MNQQPEIQFEQLLAKIRESLGSVFGRIGMGGANVLVILLLLVGVVVWLGSGLYQVGPREQAALRLFGEYRGNEGPGLHWYPPSPIGQVDIEAVDLTRTMLLGIEGLPASIDAEALMITGDLNIVNVQLAIQYRINDLEKFLFRVADPGEEVAGGRIIEPGTPEGRTLKDATEAALRQVVGTRSIDDILTIRKEQVQAETRLLLQTTLDDYQTGIEILDVALQTVRPPDEVRGAFDDVVNARVDKESRINEAKAYEQDRIPRALGQAQTIMQTALAFKAEQIAKATGEASRFLSVLKEYNKSKNVTRQRLYLEAMEDILPGVTKFILATDSSGNVLPFLPLSGEMPTSASAAK
jgi:membrane protease subunit HflK